MTGIELIAAERKRQIEKEGWTAEHDDQLCKEELAKAAVCYALPYERRHKNEGYFTWSSLLRETWSFDMSWYKPCQDNRICELEKAGALIAAEIDRLLRLGEKKI
jgi:hypothetical protein